MEPTMIHGRVRTREYSVTARSESATLALGLGAIAATAKAGQYAVTAYREWEKNQPEEPVDDGKVNAGGDAGAGASSGGSGSASDASKGERKNMFSDFFSVGSKYYEGGFEEKMTLREAALILGVRESSTEKRIKEAHRKLLILNHPDTGGSTYLAGKLNEAKDLLLKSKGR
jgi:DnaJ family protein C protein 19